MRSIYEEVGHYISLRVGAWRPRRYTRVQVVRWLLGRMVRYGVRLAA